VIIEHHTNFWNTNILPIGLLHAGILKQNLHHDTTHIATYWNLKFLPAGKN
jgi:hypothetical protein